MAQEIQQWRPSTELSITAQANRSRQILAMPTTQADAARYGKLLIGQWPNAKPADPQIYSLGITKALEQYPLGIVMEIIEPGIGLAATREYVPTQAAVREWCEQRVKFHRGTVRHAQIREEEDESRFTPEHRKTMLERWKALLHSLLDKTKVETAQ